MLFEEMRTAAELSSVRHGLTTALQHTDAVRRAAVKRTPTVRPARRLVASVRARLHVRHRHAARWSPM